MSITLRNDVFNNVGFMETVGNMFQSDKLSAIDSYYMILLHKELTDKAVMFEQVKEKLIVQYSEPSEDEGKYIFKDKESAELFETEFNELLGIKFDINLNKIEYPIELGFSAAQMKLVETLFDFTKLQAQLEARWQND